jgi:uncharacterized Zn-binding protein involved in type VI secretion
VTGPAVSGSPDVHVNGRPALRAGDTGIHSACCGTNTFTIVGGSGTVMINNQPAARKGDQVAHCGGNGKIVEASENVITGG